MYQPKQTISISTISKKKETMNLKTILDNSCSEIDMDFLYMMHHDISRSQGIRFETHLPITPIA